MNLSELRSDARKLPIDDLIAAVRDEATALADTLSKGVDEAAATSARDGMNLGISVAREVLHVALTGELPEDDDSDAAMSIEALAESYLQAIESCIAHVESADPDGFLDVTWVHPDHGALNWRGWFLFLAHDARARVAGMSGGS